MTTDCYYDRYFKNNRSGQKNGLETVLKLKDMSFFVFWQKLYNTIHSFIVRF